MMIPSPPFTKRNEDLYQAITEVVHFMAHHYQNGLKMKSFTQAEIDKMVSKTQLGTLVFNASTQRINASYLEGDQVKWREI